MKYKLNEEVLIDLIILVPVPSFLPHVPMAEVMHVEERKRKLGDLLPFEALETPKWRKKQEVSVEEMITKIMEYSKEWKDTKRHKYEPELVEQVNQDFLIQFIFHVNTCSIPAGQNSKRRTTERLWTDGN